MQNITIEDLVRKYLNFQFGNSGDGWNKIYCEVCGDGEGRTKGPRGGWRFSDEQAFYHCFNCGINANFDPDREYPYSKDMWRTLECFGIPKEEHQAIAYKNRLQDKAFVKPVRKEINIDILKIPDHWYKLVDAAPENIIAQKARAFLWDKKRINPSSYDFYLSTGISKDGPRENAIAKSMFNKLIIPYFKDGKLVYFQSRDIDKKKYINAATPRTSIIYGFDKLNREITKPLYITEGFWDAHHLNGVAVLENNMTSNQIEILKKSPRRKIVVPDKKDDTRKLATQAIELGWEIALPDIGSCEDVTAAIVQYGSIYVINSVNSHIFSGFEASVNLDLY
jgi:hypothetical protein